MPDILHKVAIKSPPSDTYRALATLDGLAGWWTTDTQGSCNAGGTLQFRFGDKGTRVKVLELEAGRHVLWQVVEGPAAWVGTKLSFELAKDGDYTQVLFKHLGWKEPSQLMAHCSTKWAMFLMSLKSLVEAGKGTPYPRDVQIGKSD
jgi:uncharacterized protein YndB with AHSA1/START domain